MNRSWMLSTPSITSTQPLMSSITGAIELWIGAIISDRCFMLIAALGHTIIPVPVSFSLEITLCRSSLT